MVTHSQGSYKHYRSGRYKATQKEMGAIRRHGTENEHRRGNLILQKQVRT